MENKKYYLTPVIVVIVIATLFYFSIAGIGRYVTGSVIIHPPFYIISWNIKTSEIAIELKNTGEDYKIQSFSVEGCGEYKTPTEIEAGTKVTFIINCNPILTEGDSFKGNIKIIYRKVNGDDLTSEGAVTGRVKR